MKSNKTLYETALEVAYNDRKDTMEKDDSHKVLLYKEAFTPVYTGYEFIYEDAQEDREEYLKREKKKSDMQKYWDQYYNCDRSNVNFATPLEQYEQEQVVESAPSAKKNVEMKEEQFISKKKAKAKSFFWALFGLVAGVAIGIGIYMFVL